MKNIKIIISCLTKAEMSDVIKFTLVMVLISILEFISIGSLFPLISMFSKNNFYENNLSIFEDNSKVFLLIIAFLLVSIFIKNFITTLFYFKLCRFSQKLRSRVSNFLFTKYIYDNYENHLKIKSGDLIRDITSLPATFQNSVFSSILLFQELLVLIGLISLLLIVNFKFTLISVVVFIIYFALFKIFFKKKLLLYGNEIIKSQALFTKFLYFSMTCIKDIKIFQVENFFKDNYEKYYNQFSEIHAKNQFLNVLPRILIEVFLIILLSLFVIVLFFKDVDFLNLLPYLTIFFAAIVRMMPSVSKILSMHNVIIYTTPSNLIVKNHLKNFQNIDKVVTKNNYTFKKNSKKKEIVEIKNISFSFNKDDSETKILRNLNCTINKNTIFGIFGKSGSGKSTLLNILCGILKPDEGDINYYGDDVMKNIALWKNKIGYVPQYVNLFDGSVINNLLYQQECNDIKNLKQKLEDVNLSKFIESLPKKYDTKLGEGGSNLSGGQRQRLGIARALLKNPEILIMDEATNSLDGKNEEQILELLLKLKEKLTVIFVSHDEKVMKICDEMINLDNQ